MTYIAALPLNTRVSRLLTVTPRVETQVGVLIFFVFSLSFYFPPPLALFTFVLLLLLFGGGGVRGRLGKEEKSLKTHLEA